MLFECDSKGHLPGQCVSVNNNAHQDGYDVEGGDYISWQDARKKGDEQGLIISNHRQSNPRAANSSPNSPSPVSCFILLTQSKARTASYPLFPLC